ncbi:asparaginase [Arthrobacter sp. H41]|uniref:asparaginase n=1 Tax=Arthrobacter sp. H41 TaxID=1312978 RepID=UPI0004B8F0AD|nr:asparaginase [Arthrobacter sp. H41]
MTPTNSPYVVLLATGGTIASRTSTNDGGATLAEDTGAAILQTTGQGTVPVEVVDVMRKGSYQLTFADMLSICASIRQALNDPLVLGVVVTHGTDTTEETAYLADLLHRDPRPVVFTGAQRAADHADPDGPDNLRKAIAVAASRDARGHGVLVSFAGKIFPAAGAQKVHTANLQAFDNPDGEPAGAVSDTGSVSMHSVPLRFDPLPVPAPEVEAHRADIVAIYPGADAALLKAALSVGSSGIVLAATGNGNANPVICAAVTDATAAGIVVVTSTRVHAGPVLPVYGNGGGKDLQAAGAIPAGLLKPSQARTLLHLLLTLKMSRPQIEKHFFQRGGLLPHAATYSLPTTPLKG